MQTRDNRIMRHYDSLSKSIHHYGESTGKVWMTLAVHWKMPIKTLKEIVKNEKARVAK